MQCDRFGTTLRLQYEPISTVRAQTSLVCAFVVGSVELDRVLAWFEVDLRQTSLVCALAVNTSLCTPRVYDIVNMTFYRLTIQGDVYTVHIIHFCCGHKSHSCCGHSSQHIVNRRGVVLSIQRYLCLCSRFVPCSLYMYTYMHIHIYVCMYIYIYISLKNKGTCASSVTA